MKLFFVCTNKENNVNMYKVYSEFAAIGVMYGQITGSS